MNMEKFFKQQGYDISNLKDMREYQDMWKSWYSGNVASFHHYQVYNGDRKINQQRMSLQMAKKVCEDWANLLMNERVEVWMEDEQKDKNSHEYLMEVLERNSFWTLVNRGIEMSFGIGTGAIVLSLEDVRYNDETEVVDVSNARTNIEFVPGTKVIPLTFEGQDVTECAFITTKTTGKQNFIFVSMHLIGESNLYEIHNFVLLDKGNSFRDVTDEQEDFVRIFYTQSEKPWFFLVRPNIINNIQYDSPYGASIFANSISTLKSIDIVYDSFANEFLLGRKRIFVTAEAVKVDPATGENKLVFDPNDVIFYVIPPDMDGKSTITDTDMTIRAEDHEKGLAMQLNVLSTKCGFGERHYKFDNGNVATATQIISENSTLFRTLKKHEITLERTLIELFERILWIGSYLLGADVKEDANVAIQFDDSIIEDKNSEMLRDMGLVGAGLMEKYEFRMKHFGESEEDAKAMVPKGEPLFGLPGGE